MLIILNLFILYLITFPNQLIGVSSFNSHGRTGTSSRLKRYLAKLIRPFVTNDLSNNILLFVFMNSFYLSILLAPDEYSKYFILTQNLLYALLSASIFSYFISLIPNEKRKTHQARQVDILFNPLVERDNVIRNEFGISGAVTEQRGLRVVKDSNLNEQFIDVIVNGRRLSKCYSVESYHIHGITTFNQGANIYDVLSSIICDDETFVIRVKNSDISLFPDLYGPLQDFESSLVWLKTIKTQYEEGNLRDVKSLSRQLVLWLENKEKVLVSYSKSIRNYGFSSHHSFFDKSLWMSNKEVFFHFFEKLKSIFSTLIKLIRRHR